MATLRYVDLEYRLRILLLIFQLIITGSLAVRAYRTKRATTVYRFYLLTGLCLLVYIIAIILLIVGYSNDWTPDTPDPVSIFVTQLIKLGILRSIILHSS
jgi:hypothetical protein